LLSPATTPAHIYTLSLHDALPIYGGRVERAHAREQEVEHGPQGEDVAAGVEGIAARLLRRHVRRGAEELPGARDLRRRHLGDPEDRKSTRLNSSHVAISYAVFCLK